MKQDINDMITIIINELENTNPHFRFGDSVKEIIELLKNNPLEDELEYLLLKELYKFMKFGDTTISIDPRRDLNIKLNTLFGIKQALENNNFTQDSIEILKQTNDRCLEYLLDPLKIKKESEDFNNRHPGARF